MSTLLETLDERVVCADGAMGTLLMERGVSRDQCFEELCLSAPDLITGIHTDYLDAGARIIETNTFGANAARLARHGLEGKVNEINWSAAQLARQAAKGRRAWVAGCVGPLGLTAAEAEEQGIDRAACYREQIGALLDGGAQLICLETFQDIEELLIALRVKQELHHCPAICSLAPGTDDRLPDGLTVEEAFTRVARNDGEILGLNCVDGPQAVRLLEGLPSFDVPLAVQPSAGTPRLEEGRAVYALSPTDFVNTSMVLIERGARIVGGCCGTTPAHIAALAKLLAEKKPPAA